MVLAGGRGARLGGADKAAIDVAGATLLERALDAVAGAARPWSWSATSGPPTARSVWTREQPAYGGPVAATYAGRDALGDTAPLARGAGRRHAGRERATVARLLAAASRTRRGRAHWPAGGSTWRWRCRRGRSTGCAPDQTDGAAMRDLWTRLDLAEVAATSDEAADVDTWADLREVLAGLARNRKIGAVNLHDWIDELCDALDVDTEVDEGLVLDLAKVVADNVVRKAAPISTYLLGYAAGLQEPTPRASRSSPPGRSCSRRSGTGRRRARPRRHRRRGARRQRGRPHRRPVRGLTCGPSSHRVPAGPRCCRSASCPTRSPAPARSRSRSPRRPSTGPTCCSGGATTRRRPAPPTCSGSSAAAPSRPSVRT